MDAGELDLLDKLPDDGIAVYRGHQEINRTGWSWTLCPHRAKFFANRWSKKGAIARGIISKRNIKAVFLGRGEAEVVADPRHVLQQTVWVEMEPADFELAGIAKIAIKRFTLGKRTSHGLSHWRRVLGNVNALCAETPEADPVVCRLFALLHDCCRENEKTDPEHGERAAAFVRELHEAGTIKITDRQAYLLWSACIGHDKGTVTDNPTVGVAWDADRLDLLRVGIVPNPELFSTNAAKKLQWRI
jgi:uncharacterized protein